MLCKAVWCASQSVQCALFNTVTSDFAYTLLLFVANQIVGRIFFCELKTSIWRTTSGGKRTGTHHKDKVAKFKCSNQSIDIQWVKIGVGIYSLQDPKLVSIKTFGTTITFLIFQWTQSWCVIIIPPQHCLAELLKKHWKTFLDV